MCDNDICLNYMFLVVVCIVIITILICHRCFFIIIFKIIYNERELLIPLKTQY
jgi:hypothetical protein